MFWTGRNLEEGKSKIQNFLEDEIEIDVEVAVEGQKVQKQAKVVSDY